MSLVPLFACSNCFTRCRYDELTKKQHFCQKCFKESLRKCSYCCTRYSPESPRHTVCPKCEGDIAKHGVPEVCSICQLKAAYTDHICVRCHRCMSKYGPPFPCRSCQKCRAFNSAQNMVNGELCCWQCVDLAKPIISPKEAEVAASSSSATTSTKGKSAKFAKCLENDAKVMPHRFDPFSGENVLNMDALRARVAVLERQLLSKEKALLQKHKEVHTLKMGASEKEKMLRQQIRDKEKHFLMGMEKLNGKVNALYNENSSLKSAIKM